MTISEALAEIEAEQTLKLADQAEHYAPDTDKAEREHDMQVLRALVRKYGADYGTKNFVGWAAGPLGGEPERAKLRAEARNIDAEIARRLALGVDLTPGQVQVYIGGEVAEQAPERLGWWLDHVLQRAASLTVDERGDMLVVAAWLLGSKLERPRRGQPRDPRWAQVVELAGPQHRVWRELKRQGVVPRQ